MFELNKNHKRYLSLGLIGSTLLVSNLFTKRDYQDVSDNKINIIDTGIPKIPFYDEMKLDMELTETNVNNQVSCKDIFISQENILKIKKLKELNYLSDRLSNIICHIPKNNVKKYDIILIKSIRLLIDNINNKMNHNDLNITIKLFIDSNKLGNSISYNNIISGEILNYLASL